MYKVDDDDDDDNNNNNNNNNKYMKVISKKEKKARTFEVPDLRTLEKSEKSRFSNDGGTVLLEEICGGKPPYDFRQGLEVFCSPAATRSVLKFISHHTKL